jgi:hypothetical protein
MATGDADDVTALRAERSALIAIIRARTAAWAAAGEPVTMSIDGESYQFESWRGAKLKEIDQLTDLITKISKQKPYWLRSRHRG